MVAYDALQRMFFICFAFVSTYFFPKFTKKSLFLITSYMVITKLRMKTFSTENKLNLMNMGKQNHNRNDLQPVLLFCFLGKFVRKR